MILVLMSPVCLKLFSQTISGPYNYYPINQDSVIIEQSQINRTTLQFNGITECEDAWILLDDFYSFCSNGIGEDSIYLSSVDGDIYVEAGIYDSVEWTTSGDGYFGYGPDSIENYYVPGEWDIYNGTVQLCLTAFASEPCADTTACVSVDFIAKPFIGMQDYYEFCANYQETDSIYLSANEGDIHVEVGNYNFVEWTTNGEGYFSYGPNSVENYYVLGEEWEMNNGSFYLSLTAYASGFCADTTASVHVQLMDKPYVFMDSTYSFCSDGQGGVIYLSTWEGDIHVEAGNYEYVEWTTSGDGYFEPDYGPYHLNNMYYPGESDLQSDSIQLCLTAHSEGECGDSFACVTVYIFIQPYIDMQDCFAFCSNNQEWDSIYLSTVEGDIQVEVSNYDSVEWITYGDGYFGYGPDSLNNYYYPGESDINNGAVQLCLTAYGTVECESVTSCVSVLFLEYGSLPFVEMQENYAFCPTGQSENSIYLSSNGGDIHVEAGNYESVEWTTSGDGYFDSECGPYCVENYYILGESDLNNDSFQLCLTAYSSILCSDSTKCVLIENIAPFVKMQDCFAFYSNNQEWDSIYLSTAGGDIKVEAGNYDSVLWGASGDGYFGYGPDSVENYYFPGESDIYNGTVQLCLTAYGIEPCLNETACVIVYFVDTILQPYVEMQDYLAFCSIGLGEDSIYLSSGSGDIYVEAGNYEYVEWTTSGDGYFSNDSIENYYYPGEQDINNGNVQLCLTAYATESCADSTACVSIDIIAPPFVYMNNNYCFCLNGELEGIYLSSGEGGNIHPEAENYDSVEWTTGGDGYFEYGPNNIENIYYLGGSDIEHDSVQLCLTAYARESCGSDTACVAVKLIEPPFITMDNYSLFCFNGQGSDSLYLSSDGGDIHVEAGNYEYVEWTASGNGYFGYGTNSVENYYFPGESDYEDGYCALFLCAYTCGSCLACSYVFVELIAKPFVDMQENYAFCSIGTGADSIHLSSEGGDIYVEADNYDSVEWTTSGDGYFGFGPDSYENYYFPGEQDINNANVQLCLTAYLSECSDSTECVLVEINSMQLMVSVNDDIICNNDIYQTNPMLENYSIVSWFTNGDGYFENDDEPITIYHLGQNDLADRYVQLCLEAFGTGVCQSRSKEDCMMLYYGTTPQADAGADSWICGHGIHQLKAIASDYDHILWNSSGDGVFGDASSLSTFYVPGVSDINQGSVMLTLTAFSSIPSCNSESDQVVLQIYSKCQSYTYDNLGRIRKAIFTGNNEIVYAYDKVGNRTSAVIGHPKTWIGVIDEKWHIPGNWSPMGVPGPEEDVLIPQNAPHMPEVKVPGLGCHKVFLEQGATLNIKNGVTLNINGVVVGK
jgi:hypothetical protein